MQLVIWSYFLSLLIKKIAFQQLEGGLCDEFDSFSFELKVNLEVHFSVLTQYLVVHVTTNLQNSYMQIFQTLWGRETY